METRASKVPNFASSRAATTGPLSAASASWNRSSHRSGVGVRRQRRLEGLVAVGRRPNDTLQEVRGRGGGHRRSREALDLPAQRCHPVEALPKPRGPAEFLRQDELVDGQDDGDKGERPADEGRGEADDSGGVAGPQHSSGLQRDHGAEDGAGEKPRDVQPVAVQEEPSLDGRLRQRIVDELTLLLLGGGR